jgi:hypothetical protein
MRTLVRRFTGSITSCEIKANGRTNWTVRASGNHCGTSTLPNRECLSLYRFCATPRLQVDLAVENSILSFPFPLALLSPLSPPAPSLSLSVHPRSPASPCVASHLYNTVTATRHISLCLFYYPRFVPSSAHNNKDNNDPFFLPS